MPEAVAAKKKTYSWGTGRRKTSIARVRICAGSGKFEINDVSLEKVYLSPVDRESITRPLRVTEVLKRVDVFARTEGGGRVGQIGAVVMGIARALCDFDENLEARLREFSFLTRDARMKERKKFGLRGARRGCQFSKR